MSRGAAGGHSRSGGRSHDLGMLADAFKLFSSKYGGKPGSNEKVPLATNSDISKWCQDSGILDGALTKGDVDIAFAGVKMRGSKYLTMEDMPRFLEALSSKYSGNKINCDRDRAMDMLIDKLANSNFKLHGTTQAANDGAVDRLSEIPASRGTVTHVENYRQEARKERF